MTMDEIRESRARGPRGWWLAVLVACLCFAGPVWAEDDATGEEAEHADEEAAEGEEEQGEARRADGPTPRLFMMPVDSLQGEITQIVTERVNESTRRQLDSERRLELVPGLMEVLGSSGQGVYALISEAESQYTSGIGLLRAGDHQAAAETLQRAVDLMVENLSGLQNYNFLSDALSNLSLAYFHSDFDLDARQNMQRFAQLRPGATLDPEIFPEDLRSIFEDEVDRVERAETGILTIEADRTGAQVYIDGDLKGATPVVVEDVGFGHHYMVVRDGEAVWTEVIRVRGRGQEQTFEVEFDSLGQEDESSELPAYYTDLQQNLRSGRFGQDLHPYLIELTNQTGADFIAWVLLVREGPRYIAAPFVYRASDAMVIQGENVDFNLELSNMRSRVSRLSAIISMAVSDMPEDLAVEDVDLAPEPTPVATPEVPEEEEEPEEVAEVDDHPSDPLPVPGTTPPERGPVAELPDERERSNTLRYVGYGGAAALAGGAIAGTIIMLVRASGSSDPTVFEAEVEW